MIVKINRSQKHHRHSSLVQSSALWKHGFWKTYLTTRFISTVSKSAMPEREQKTRLTTPREKSV